jgi:hypothetical protein
MPLTAVMRAVKLLNAPAAEIYILATSVMLDSRASQLSDSDLLIVKLPCHTFLDLTQILQRLFDTRSLAYNE